MPNRQGVVWRVGVAAKLEEPDADRALRFHLGTFSSLGCVSNLAAFLGLVHTRFFLQIAKFGF